MKPTKAERLIQRMKKQAETRTPKVNTPEANAAIPPRQTITLVPVPVFEWTGCYDESWRDLITPESFSHPAKAGRKLLHNIFSHLESIGALTPGRSIVVDPFGGVGTTGIIGAWRGYPVICCELEPKFIELTKANFAKETPKWEVMRLPIPRVVQGDSRKLREHIQTEIDAIVSSPPYTEEVIHNRPSKMTDGIFEGRTASTGLGDYGQTEGQLGELKPGNVDAVVSSPPYTGDINVLDFFGKKSASEQSYNSKYFGPNDVGYGKTGGQLGELETGDVDAIVSSPPYAELGANIKGHGIEGAGVSKDPKYGQAEYGVSPGQLGQMKEAKGVDVIVSSPPYTNSELTKPELPDDLTSEWPRNVRNVGYGKSNEQLGAMSDEGVDAVISSPPYAEIATGAGGLNTKPPQHDGQQGGRSAEAPSQETDQKYGETEGQMARMEKGEVDAIISSPPYADQPLDPGNSSRPEAKIARLISEGKHEEAESVRQNLSGPASNLRQKDYGSSEGQLGAMEKGEVDVVISSPPYVETTLERAGPPSKMMDALKTPGTSTKSDKLEGYGHADGQLGSMDAGGVDAVISSPPYAEIATGAGGLNTKPPQRDGQQSGRSPETPSQETDQKYGSSEGQMARMEKGEVDAIISSPPYADQPINPGETSRPEAKIARLIAEGKYEDAEKVRRNCSGNASNLRQQDYGSSEGQLGAMEPGGVDAVVSSPPYSETVLNSDQSKFYKIGKGLRGGTNEEYGISPGQLGILKEKGGVDAIVSSPPYADGGVHGSSNEIDHDEQERAKRAFGNPLGTSSVTGYGTSEGQLSAKEPGAVDAVVSSPPFGSGDSASAQSITERTDKSAEWVKANCGPAATQGYGTSPGQMAQMPVEQETFWTAARDIVRECYAILKPGGYAVWIVKAFVRDKAIVDFPNDWRKLCEYCGFETITEVHAMLVKQQEYKNLWNEQVVDKKERKSFFRRLAESKGSPRIDYEVVLFTRKR